MSDVSISTITLCSEDGVSSYVTFPGTVQASPVQAGGSGAIFNVSCVGSASPYNVVVTLDDGGSGYSVGDSVTLFSNTSSGGSTPQLLLKVVTVLNGKILTFLNTTPFSQTVATPVFITDSAHGSGAVFEVSVVDSKYKVKVRTGGDSYTAGEIIKVPGDLLNGYTPKNDLLVNVGQVGIGNVLGLSNVTGTPFNTSFSNATPIQVFPKYGRGAILSYLERLEGTDFANSNAPFEYSSSSDFRNRNSMITRGGSGYSIGNIFEIPAGTIGDNGQVLGVTRLVGVGGVDSQGAMQAADLYYAYNYKTVPTIQDGAGTHSFDRASRPGVAFNISNYRPKHTQRFREAVTNAICQFPVITNPDTYSYENVKITSEHYLNVGDILNIPGTQLGGLSPDNDLKCMVAFIDTSTMSLGNITNPGIYSLQPIVEGIPYMANRIWSNMQAS